MEKAQREPEQSLKTLGNSKSKEKLLFSLKFRRTGEEQRSEMKEVVV